jgi:hypothetical protein
MRKGNRSSLGKSNSVNESLGFAKMQLENFAERIAKNEEKISRERITEWTTMVISIANEIDDVESFENEMNGAINEYTSSEVNLNSSSKISEQTNDIMEIIKKRQISKVNDNEHGQFATEIKKYFITSDNEDLIVNTTYTDADFKCPYTQTKMIEPMKKYVDLIHIPYILVSYDFNNLSFDYSTACIHRLSKGGLNALLKSSRNNKGVKCPVFGCNALWTQESALPDKNFEFRMEKFYRNQVQNILSTSQIEATEIN